MAEFNDETVRELNDSIRELTEVMQSAMGITGSSMGSQKDFSKALGNASSSASVLSSRNKEVATSATNVSTANKLAAEAAYTVGKSLSTLGTATKESKDALVTLGKTLLDTREGMSKYNAALNQAASAAATGLSAFGPVGKAIGFLLKPLTMLVEQVFAFQDNLFLAKDELAKFGAVGQLTTTDIQKMGEASGYSTFEIEKYAKTVTKAGIGLVGLGGSVSQGVVEFTKLTKITDAEQRRLLSLGVTMDNFVENTADFVKLQTSSGRMITEKMKTDGYMQRAAKDYTDNLLVLAALSGESVAEQKQKQMALAREREAQIANLATTMKIKQLENGTAADKAEASRLQKQMDLEQKTITLTSATLGMDAAKSLQHFLKTGVITPETMKIMRGTGMSLEELRIALSQGKDVSAKFVDGLVKADLRLVETQGLALQLSKEYADGMGLNSERLEKLAALQGKSVEQTKKEVEAQVKAGLGNDEAEQNRKKALENEKKFRASIDEFSKSFQTFIPKFNEFAKIMTDLVDRLAKVNWREIIDDMIAGFKNLVGYFNNIKDVVTAPRQLGEFLGGKAADIKDYVTGAPHSGSLGNILGFGSSSQGSQAPGQSVGGSSATGGSSAVAPKGSVDSLLNLIGKIESGNDYNIMVDRKSTPKPLTTMTIAEVLAMQEQMGSRNAAGKYQIQKDTLSEFMGKANLKPDDLFNESNQEKLAKVLLERRGLQSYLDKKLSPDKFADNLSMEWAALPYNTGKTYYEGRGGNKAGVGRDEFMQSLPKARLGGAFAGPNSGYPVMLHGAETVVPTPNPSTSLIKIEGEAAANKITNALSGMNSDALNSIMQDMYSMMEERLSAMIDKLSTSNDIQDKLLKAQM
jgi:hypothetical protein